MFGQWKRKVFYLRAEVWAWVSLPTCCSGTRSGFEGSWISQGWETCSSEWGGRRDGPANVQCLSLVPWGFYFLPYLPLLVIHLSGPPNSRLFSLGSSSSRTEALSGDRRHQPGSSNGHVKGVPRISLAAILRKTSALHSLFGQVKGTKHISL